jgi:hypothetical protein
MPLHLLTATLSLLPQAPGAPAATPDDPTRWLGTAYRTSAALGDVDGDGVADLVIGRNGPLSVRFGLPKGGIERFGPERTTGHEVGVSCEQAGQPHLVDVDRDGDLDLVALHTPLGSTGYVAWFANDGKGNFAPALRLQGVGGGELPIDGSTSAMALADWNRDGHLDLFVARGGVVVHLGSANGLARQAVDLEIATSGPLAVVDTDADGQLDVVVGTDTAIVRHAHLAQWRGHASKLADVANDVAQAQIAFADWNGDGAIDLLLVEPASPQAMTPPNLDAGEKAHLERSLRIVAALEAELQTLNRTPPPRNDAAAMQRRSEQQRELAQWLAGPRETIARLRRPAAATENRATPRLLPGTK